MLNLKYKHCTGCLDQIPIQQDDEEKCQCCNCVERKERRKFQT